MGRLAAESRVMRLRDRLQRLYENRWPEPARHPPELSPRPSAPRPSDLARALGGEWRERSSGRLVVVDRRFPGDFQHGGAPLSATASLSGPTLPRLARDPGAPFPSPEEVLFLDTETTGLSGGAGTCVFLVGVGCFQGDEFLLRQYFLPDFRWEEAFLEELKEMVLEGARGRGFQILVSFNGKAFDLHLLENRYLLNRLQPPFRHLLHLDLLHVSRALWKGDVECCSLQGLEDTLLGFRRPHDIPSFLIPRAYLSYLHRGQTEDLRRVLEHNRLDLLSLVSLLRLVACGLEAPDPAIPLDPCCASRWWEGCGDLDRAVNFLRRSLQNGASGENRSSLLFELGRLEKKRGSHLQALHHFLEGIETCAAPPLEAFEEAAKLLEHSFRDLAAALRLVERALHCHPGHPQLLHRRHRLRCRLAGVRWY